MTLRVRPLTLLLPLALIIAACGSSSKSSSSTSTSAAAATTSSSASAPTGAPITVTTKKAKKLGTVLAAGPKRLTVYLWEADTAGASNCSGACANVWPPVTGKPTVGGSAVAADLGTITRADGTTQVTYKGHPLYYFSKDKDNGDTYGQGSKSFGAGWYVLAPSGKKIDTT